MSKAWMPFYGGDFLGNTMHLSRGEIGSYVLLLWHHWEHGSLPADEKELRRIARVHPWHWSRVWRHLQPFFTPNKDNPIRISQLRLLTELSKKEELSNKRKAAALHMHRRKRANAEHLHTQSQSQSQTEEAKASSGARKRGTRLSIDWWPSQENVDYALSHGLSLEQINHEAEKFRNYWISKAGAGATKLNWNATFQNWILTATEQRGHGNGRTGETLAERGHKLAEEARRQEEFARDLGGTDDAFGGFGSGYPHR
jgi:uncharacterized protein YdaU (DUF1376 family)